MKSPRRSPTSGVYVIQGPNGVYVGEAGDCWTRQTLKLAVMLGLECGIVREMPGSIVLERRRVEGEIKTLFERRGMLVVSFAAKPGDRKIKMQHPLTDTWNAWCQRGEY